MGRFFVRRSGGRNPYSKIHLEHCRWWRDPHKAVVNDLEHGPYATLSEAEAAGISRDSYLIYRCKVCRPEKARRDH